MWTACSASLDAKVCMCLLLYESTNVFVNSKHTLSTNNIWVRWEKSSNLQSAFISSLQPHSTSRSRRSSISFSFSPLSTNFTNQNPPHCYRTQGTAAAIANRIEPPIVSPLVSTTSKPLLSYSQTLTKSNWGYPLGPPTISWRTTACEHQEL